MALVRSRLTIAAQRVRRLDHVLRRRKGRARKSLRTGGLVLIAVGLAALLATRVVKIALLVLLLSVFVAYLAAPSAERLRHALRLRGRSPLPRPVAILLLYVLVGGGAALAWWVIAPHFDRQLAQFTERLPGQIHASVAGLSAIERWPSRLGLSAQVAGVLRPAVSGLSLSLRTHVSYALEEAVDSRRLLPWLLFVPLVSFVLLTQFDAFRRTTMRVLPDGHLRWRGNEFFGHVNSVLAGYTRAQVISCVLVAIACAAAFAALGIPWPLVVGLAAGVFEFFPLIGPVATALLVTSLADGMRLALAIGFLVALRLAQDYVVYPRLLGSRMHLHPVAIVLATWCGAWLGGLVGVFCAVPLVGVGAVAVRHWREYLAIEDLLRSHARLQAAGVAAAPAPAAPAALEPALPRAEIPPAAEKRDDAPTAAAST